jgi:hypothetical protein
MSQQPDRAQITVRCRRCRVALARMLERKWRDSTSPKWRVDRLDRVPWIRRPLRVGDPIGDPRFGVAANDGTLPHPRMLPIELEGERFSLTCRRCGLPSTGELRELQARADRAERRGKTVVLWP